MLATAVRLVFLACAVISTCAAANDRFVGNWKLNPAKSTADQMTVESAGGNKYTFDFGGGSETIVVDGTDHPSRLYGGDTLSVAAEGDKWKVVRKAKGRMMLSAIWSVAKDDSTLTDRYTAFNANGSAYTVIYTYKRKTGGSRFAGTWVSVSMEPVNFFLGLQVRPFEESGLSIIDSSSQITGNMNFAAPLVRRHDKRTLELMRKKSDGEISSLMQLELSPDLKSLTITPHSPGADGPHILVFDRQASG